MSFVWSSALKDLRRRWRDPLSLLLGAGIPLVTLALISLAFGGSGGVRPQAHLLVTDEDESFGSNLLLGAFGQGPATELVLVEEVDREEGRDRIEAGKASGWLLIPVGFGQAVLEEDPVTITLVTNPAQTILPGILEEFLSVMVDAVFYLQRLLGEPLEEIAAGPEEGEDTLPDQTVAEISITVNQLIERASTYLFPPVLALESGVDSEESEADFNLGALFFPGMFFMAVLFLAQGFSGDVWEEKLHGTLRRVITTPAEVAGFLAGKLLAAAVIFAALSLLVFLAGSWLYDLPLSRLPLAVVWSSLSGLLFLVFYNLIHLYAGSQTAGNFMTSAVTFPLLMAGGSFFPFEIMPDWLASVGRWTPNGWALEQLKAILAGEMDMGGLTVAFLGMAVLGGVVFVMSARRLRRGFALA
jgi:ABC-type multidrug transport system permease subunit